nr:immunoglobulin heavy chain junction region [Mus musculus]
CARRGYYGPDYW